MNVCPRHGLVARFEARLCGQCFREARAVADARSAESKIEAMRLTSADAILRRLGGR